MAFSLSNNREFYSVTAMKKHIEKDWKDCDLLSNKKQISRSDLCKAQCIHLNETHGANLDYTIL